MDVAVVEARFRLWPSRVPMLGRKRDAPEARCRFRKPIPTSGTSVEPRLISTTEQPTSSFITPFLICKIWFTRRRSRNGMRAPWVLTTSIFVRSTNGEPLARFSNTITGIDNRWLRRCCVNGYGRTVGRFKPSSRRWLLPA